MCEDCVSLKEKVQQLEAQVSELKAVANTPVTVPSDRAELQAFVSKAEQRAGAWTKAANEAHRRFSS